MSPFSGPQLEYKYMRISAIPNNASPNVLKFLKANIFILDMRKNTKFLLYEFLAFSKNISYSG